MSVQTLTITDWLPPPVLNGSRQKHWAVLRKEADVAKKMAWAAARQARWTFVPGKVRLTVVFVFGVKRARDTDNTTARAKHLIDGLKKEFFHDDSTEWLELVVRAEVRRGVKQTVISLEPIGRES